jgi:hypothetical protein
LFGRPYPIEEVGCLDKQHREQDDLMNKEGINESTTRQILNVQNRPGIRKWHRLNWSSGRTHSIV